MSSTPPASKPPLHTRLAWILGLGGMLLFEFWTLFNKTPGDTLSETVWWAGAHRPILALVAGVLMGHFFGWNPRTLIPFMLGMVGGALYWQPYKPPVAPPSLPPPPEG